MNDIPSRKVGPGRCLIYLLGPSGAGKDSLIRYAQAECAQEALRVPRRFITRPRDSVHEDHVPVSEAEFDRLATNGRFSLQWQGHGLRYGIGREIDTWLTEGRLVLLNGSRAHLGTAAQRYPDLVPVAIHVDPAVLRRRLRARGREDAAAVEQRLARSARLAQVDHPALQIVDNSRTLDSAGRQLLGILARVGKRTAPAGRKTEPGKTPGGDLADPR